MKLTEEQLARLAGAIAETADQEIDCEQMLARAAAFLEAVRTRPDDLPEALRAVARHLSVCPECREEIDLLLTPYTEP